MKFGVLGTGIVGRTLAAKLAELHHEVMIGTRDVTATLAHTESDSRGNAPLRIWKELHPAIELGTFRVAAAHGEVLMNTTASNVSLEVVQAIGSEHLDGEILIDTANPLEFLPWNVPLARRGKHGLAG
jgi:8-hydroxy-5-deazaflavin:NADPH oxidoreductase